MTGGVWMTDSKKEFLLKASAPSDAEVLEFITRCPDECLQFRNGDGSIDLDGVKEYMTKARKNKILDNYRGQIKSLTAKTSGTISS
jgi:hypothetical protein